MPTSWVAIAPTLFSWLRDRDLRRSRQTTAIQCCHSAHFCRAESRSAVSWNGDTLSCSPVHRRRIALRPKSSRHLGRRSVAEMTLQTIEQRRLIGMDDPARARDLDELGFVDFPRRAAGWRPSVPSRRTRARVFSIACNRRSRDRRAAQISSPGLFERLAPRGRLERPRRDRRTFRDAPGCAAVVVARRDARAEPRSCRRRSGRAPCPTRAFARDSDILRSTVQDDLAAMQALVLRIEASPRMRLSVTSVYRELRSDVRSAARSGSHAWSSRVSRTRSSIPADVLAHATPDVLANHLPPELCARSSLPRSPPAR